MFLWIQLCIIRQVFKYNFFWIEQTSNITMYYFNLQMMNILQQLNGNLSFGKPTKDFSI